MRIYCKGGTGGNGMPKYGGIGGKGGDCYIEATNNSNEVIIFTRRKFFSSCIHDDRYNV
jgi:serine/threonine-protein kinase OSR1/STK39